MICNGIARWFWFRESSGQIRLNVDEGTGSGDGGMLYSDSPDELQVWKSHRRIDRSKSQLRLLPFADWSLTRHLTDLRMLLMSKTFSSLLSFSLSSKPGAIHLIYGKTTKKKSEMADSSMKQIDFYQHVHDKRDPSGHCDKKLRELFFFSVFFLRFLLLWDLFSS